MEERRQPCPHVLEPCVGSSCTAVGVRAALLCTPECHQSAWDVGGVSLVPVIVGGRKEKRAMPPLSLLGPSVGVERTHEASRSRKVLSCPNTELLHRFLPSCLSALTLLVLGLACAAQGLSTLQVLVSELVL